MFSPRAADNASTAPPHAYDGAPIVFAILGHLVPTKGPLPLDDLPGAAGRMDALCRCVTAALSVSHGLRREVDCYLVLSGPPGPPKTVVFRGAEVKNLRPDERSVAALTGNALALTSADEFSHASPGVKVRSSGLDRLLLEHAFAVLDPRGDDIRGVAQMPAALLLSDHLGFTAEEERAILGLARIAVGPRVVHGDQAITIVQNERDRRAAGGR